MAAIYGGGFVRLRPDLTGFGAELNAKMKGAGITGALGKIGKLGGLALIGGIGAAVGAGIKGVVDFAGFERQMNEVFTLLPGISGDAMDEMTEQVQGFSKEFGTLPTEVVPALYQSISAGVPKENVFDFLETAQKAALGGVTELETAVDGISSVVNAYGSDVIDAGEASDLMFTAVRLGKTNFDELSNSLFQVTPTASALGVQFGDVTAALAAMTAQGTPTSVATTQLRQLFVELSKEGGVAAKAFEDMAGKSFQDFIGEGGNVAEALEIMQGAAEDSGVQLQDMFGSVEAGAAALSLSGSDAFTNALGEMADSAGATDAAFAQMDQGLGRSWDKIKAAVSNALLDIGQRLAPFVQTFSDFLADKLPIWIDTAARAFDRISQWWAANGPAITATVSAVFSAVGEAIGAVVGAIQNVIEWFRQGQEGAESSFGGIAEVAGEIWPRVQEVISGVMEVIRTVIETVTKIIGAVWSQHGERIMAVIKTVWGFVRGTIEAALKIIKGIIDTVMGILTGDWSRAWDGIKGIVGGVWDAIKNLVGSALEVLKNIIPIALDFIQEVWERVWDTVVGLLGAVWDDITEAISTGIDNVKQFFIDLPGNILEWLGDLGSLLLNVGSDIIGGLIQGIKNMAGSVVQALKDFVLDKIPDAIKSFFGIGSPAKLMVPFGASLPEGLAVGITRGSGFVDRAIDDLSRTIPRNFGVSIDAGTSSSGEEGILGSGLTVNTTGDAEVLAREILDRVEFRQAVKGRS